MAKDRKHKPDAEPREEAPAAPAKLKGGEYAGAAYKLHVELVKLQEWVKHTGLKVCIVFEGRDGAGKGGTIKAHHRAREPARVPRRRAARADRAREDADVHPALPAAPAGRRRDRDLRPQLVQPRRRRARHGLLHRGAGAATSCRPCPLVEKAIVESGVILLKYWLEVSPEEQTRRLEARIDDGRKIWKLSPMDLKSYSRWYDYSRARDEMFAATDTAVGAVVRGAHPTTRGAARLNIISDISRPHPVQEVPREKVELPKRGKPGDYREPDYPYRFMSRTVLRRGTMAESSRLRQRVRRAGDDGPAPAGARMGAQLPGGVARRPTSSPA